MSNSKFVAGLILGAAAGTFIALFANSEKGQDLWDDVSSKGKDIWDDTKDKASDWSDKAKDKYGDLSDAAKDKYSDLSKKAKRKYSDYSEEINDLIDQGKKYIASLEKKAKDIKDAAIS